MITNNLIRDCPITPADLKRAMNIYGKDFASIKGKTKRLNPKHITTPTLMNLPDHIIKWHVNVTICIDIFYINKMPFFHTISRKLQFRTAEFIESESLEVLSTCLRKVIDKYKNRGFSVDFVHGDKQFQCLKEDMAPVKIQIASKGENLSEVKRSIQTIKGDIQILYHALPFKKYPPLMIKEMLEHQANIRNRFPGRNGVSSTMGPYTIMTGLPQPSYSDFKLEFGQYVQVHNHPSKTNDMRAKTTPVIALKSLGSQNG